MLLKEQVGSSGARMVSCAENKVDWFRTILEILRHVIFVGFYLLSARMVFVTLTHTTPVVSMVVASVAVGVCFLTCWNIRWAVYGFVIFIPVVSGFQVIGFMKGLPPFECWVREYLSGVAAQEAGMGEERNHPCNGNRKFGRSVFRNCATLFDDAPYTVPA